MFSWRAFQGQDMGETVSLDPAAAGGFDGTELLTGRLSLGDWQSPPVLTFTPTWNPDPSHLKIDSILLGALTSALYPGSYNVTLARDGTGAALAYGLLELYPNTGGAQAPWQISLASVSRAQSILPELSQNAIDALPWALASATKTIENYVGRALALRTFDEIIRPNNSIKLRLRTKPVAQVSRLNANAVKPLRITNGGPAQMATVAMTTLDPKLLQITTLVFTSVLAGVATTQTLVVGSYPTFNALAAAINALGNGWSATLDPNHGAYPTADAFGFPGAVGATNGRYAEILTHDWPLSDWWLDANQGVIELNEPIPHGYVVRSTLRERSDSRYWGVRCTYRAGYAILDSDLAQGFPAVPTDLEGATIATAQNIIESTPLVGPLMSQAVKDRSYTLKNELSAIPSTALSMLSAYQAFVI
jgi:hypothetical protein